MEYKTYRDRRAYAQSINPHSPIEVQMRAALAAKEFKAAIWHTGDSKEGLAQDPEDGDYLIDVDDYLVGQVTFTHHVSRKGWFDSVNEEVPQPAENPA